jgi:hypothetical protein
VQWSQGQRHSAEGLSTVSQAVALTGGSKKSRVSGKGVAVETSACLHRLR